MTPEAARPRARRPRPPRVRRLNFGCGGHTLRTWFNTDQKHHRGVDVSSDLLSGLPFRDDTFEYVVSIHSLPEITWYDIVPGLQELRRVLRPGGWIRIALPDVDRGIAAYLAGDRDYFLVPDEDAKSLGGKFAVQMTWYSYTRLLFTWDFTAELLEKAGFQGIVRCAYRETHSPFPDIVELDNREAETLFVEATK